MGCAQSKEKSQSNITTNKNMKQSSSGVMGTKTEGAVSRVDLDSPTSRKNSSLREPDEPPSGESVSYETVAAAAAAASKALSAVASSVGTIGDRGCPPYREDLGRCTWTLLHSTAAYIPEQPSKKERTELKEFMHHLSVFYPCKECAKEFQEIIQKHPPLTRTRQEFVLWMGHVHNIVNKRLGKPKFDCSRLNERWRDGWKDGSCD